MAKKKSGVAGTRILRGQSDRFWNAVQVYPAVIRKGTDVKDYRAQALSHLKKCGINNLRVLIEKTLLPNPDDATPGQLAGNLMAADVASTLQFLAEFIRGKGRPINEEYDIHFPTTDRRTHSAQLHELSQGKRGGLKQFLKLALLYEDDEEAIDRIFVRKLWRGRKTTFEFRANKSLDAEFVKRLDAKKKSLAESLADAFDGLDLRFFNAVALGRWDITLLQREYAPAVRPDYRDIQKTIHGFGWIMIGIERKGQRILLKGGGKKAIPLVQQWFSHELNTELKAAETDAFKNYDAKTVEDALLGDYAEKSPVDLVAMGFRRTLAPQHSPMAVEPPFPGQPIRRDLRFGREKGLFRVRSLSDLSFFRLSHAGNEARVEVEMEVGGGIILRLDNSDLSEEEVDKLRVDFETNFGIPLDRRIDPQNLLLGAVDVYNYLLEIDRTEGLAEYQRRALKKLLNDKVLWTEQVEVLVCPKQQFLCKLGGRPVLDEDIAECPECQSELEVREVEFLRHNDTEIRKRVGTLLQIATGWKFFAKAVRFEKEDFYPLVDPSRPDRQIRVYFAKRIGNRILQCLDRSLQPVFVVHTGGDVEHAHLDATGVAHISFARALAAVEDADVRKRFCDDAKTARDDLILRQDSKVFHRAQNSRRRIEEPPGGYTGNDYEMDVFNIIRSLFPYTEYWTGTNRPDGFCSLIYYDDANLRSPLKHNWSYDAKFTREDDGYDLDVAEERKAWDYIAALAKQPELRVVGNDLNGHAIISNNVSRDQMRKVAEFVRREHRLGKNHPSLKIIFINDRFLLQLYDDVRSNSDEYRKRWPFLSERFAKLLNDENRDGYVLLDQGTAKDLCTWVLKRTPVDNPPDMQLLREDLEETMTE